MAAADYYTQVYTMFVGYFGRPPAQSGLDNYANLVDKAGGNLAVVIDDFYKSDESKAFFDGKSVEQQVNQIFQNLFGRDALPAGLNYWTNLINNGTVALSQAAYAIAFNAAAADVAVRDAKVASAKAWVAGLDTTNEILVYGTDSGRSAGRDDDADEAHDEHRGEHLCEREATSVIQFMKKFLLHRFCSIRFHQFCDLYSTTAKRSMPLVLVPVSPSRFVA